MFFSLGKTFESDTDIPDLSSKVIIVTGGNNGLGAESCLQLAKRNAHVYLAARTQAKAEAAIAKIKEEVPDAKVTFLELDLASLASIRQAVETFNASSARLDILLNNAGVMALPASTTKDGYEIQFGTNHVGHFLFTRLLMPTLQRTADEPHADVRIVNVSSMGHRMPPKGGLVLSDVCTDMAAYSTWVRYGQSKLANILFTKELARRYPSIKCVTLHPGGIYTGLSTGFEQEHPYLAMLMKPVVIPFTKSIHQGALTQLFAATSEAAKTGTFYMPVAKEQASSAYGENEKLATELWSWSEKEMEKHGY